MPTKRFHRRTFLAQAAGTSVALPLHSRSNEPSAKSAATQLDRNTFTWDDLVGAVNKVIQSKRVGRPVFVRLTQSQTASSEAIGALASLLSAARWWIGQPLTRLYAVGGAAGGPVSLTAIFADGASALLSVAAAPAAGDGLDVMVLGNHGVIYHDAGQGPLWESAARGQRGDRKDEALVQKALRSAKPVTVRDGERP